jgi:hypothetical protein
MINHQYTDKYREIGDSAVKAGKELIVDWALSQNELYDADQAELIELIENMEEELDQSIDINMLEQLYEEVGKSTFRITKSEDNGDGTNVSQGSGFVFRKEGDDYFILTNWHVVETENLDRTFAVFSYNSKEYQATLVENGFTEEKDIAILKVTTSDDLTVLSNFITESLSAEDIVYSINDGGGYRNKIQFGTFQGTANIQDDNYNWPTGVMKHSIPIVEGASGSVVVSYLDGEFLVVGLNFGRNASSDGGYAIKERDLQALIEGVFS